MRGARTDQKASQASFYEWSKKSFNLKSLLGKFVMSRISNDATLEKYDANSTGCAYLRKAVNHSELEGTLFDSSCDTRNSRMRISGAIIRKKAIQLARKVN